ncbi:alkaline phosphatase family protein [Neobacillus sp. SAB-20_R2A]|uniref:alkaline phosphatase family protein n=1 Tax=Neobacillus sp. SAB-20_R2A TaxID=3120519 RepID=UPI003C6E26C3
MKKKLAVLLSVFFVLSACTRDYSQKQNNSELPKKETVNSEEKETTIAGKLPKIDHIVIIVEENHSQEQIIGNLSAPYINSLAAEGASLTNNHGTSRPSQPNYLDLFSGSNQGVSSNDVPESKFSAPNLGSELIEKGFSFAGYSEDLPSIGFNGKTSGNYVRKHNPWVNFSNLPQETNQPLGNFPKDFSNLPTVSFIIPNQQNNMHDGSIEQADKWLKEHIDSYLQWAKRNNSLLIVTWDEDNGSKENKIPTIFIGPMVKPGKFNEDLSHFNLLRTIEDIYGLGHAGKSDTVQPIINIWK